MVKAQCTSCHSSKLIIANHFTRDGWKQKIRWMQANHNLWDLGETEKQVLDYLEKYYAPTQTSARRQPLRDIKWYELDVK
jgi:glucan phosphorylase